MSALTLQARSDRHRLGLKGAGAAQWLASCGLTVPALPNSWVSAGSGADEYDSLLLARLGATEFFMETAHAGTVTRLVQSLEARPPGVYPVLREDAAFVLKGAGVHEVLAQVCNVDFAAIDANSGTLAMTLMIGVAVLVVPQEVAGERCYRIWCDPSFGPYLGEALGAVVVECNELHTGE